ncbi:MAG: mechanosensitive ion channel domain-containing protein [Waddliaceae bacterium]
MYIKKALFFSIIVSSVFSLALYSAEPPNPMKLKSSWWEYFGVDGEVYEQHAAEIKEELQKILSGLEKEQVDQASVLIKRLNSNIEVYSLAKQENIEKPVPKPFLDSYSLQQQIDVAKQIVCQRSVLESEKKEEKFLTNRISKLSNHLDKIIVSYQEMQDNTCQKLMQGLEILNTRFTIAINKEKLRIVRSKIETLIERLDQSEEELAFARNHIDFMGIDISEIKTGLAEAKQELEKARQETLQTALKAQPAYDNSLTEKLKNSIQQLKEYKTSIKELSAELAVLMQESKLKIAGPFENGEELDKQFAACSNKLSNISNQKSEWDKKNEDELHRFKAVIEEDPTPDNEIEDLQTRRSKLVQENRLLLQQIDGRVFTAGAIIDLYGQISHAHKSALSRWWSNAVDSVSNCCEEIISWYNQTLFKIGEQPITFKHIVKALLVLLGAYIISYVFRKILAKAFKKKTTVSHGFIYSINRLIHYVILSIGLIIAMSSMGLDFYRIYIVLGALSVGIGFGLQSLVNNFVSGLIILFTRNIKVGDYIELASGQWGNVLAIHVQNTIIRTCDGLDIVIPNSSLVTEKYTNWTRRDPYKRLHIPFCAAFGTDKLKVKEAAIKAALNVPAAIGQAQGVADPQCWLVGFGKNGLMFELVVWTNVFRSEGHGSAASSFYWELESALTDCDFHKGSVDKKL